MTTGIIHSEQNLEKQIEKHMGGCMAGFFSIFDRNHLLSSSSHHHHKRLPSSLPPAIDSASDYSISCGGSPSSRSGEIIIKPPQPSLPSRSSHSLTLKHDQLLRTPPPKPDSSKSPSSAPGFEVDAGAKLSSSPWKFTRDAPRLSLDSRAVVDAKGKLHPRQIRTPPPAASNHSDESDTPQRRSPSVVARLMGLDNLPPQPSDGECTTPHSTNENRRAELRRSASESRSRDLLPLHCRLFIDGGNGNGNGNSIHSSATVAYQQNVSSGVNVFNGEDNGGAFTGEYPREYNGGGGGYNAGTFTDGSSRFGWGSSAPQTEKRNNHQGRMTSLQTQTHHHQITRKGLGFYDSGDFFPDLKSQPTSSAAVYSEVEKRLRMSGIDEPCRDLETLKQILEALKLKGLLHSSSNKPALSTTTEHEDIQRRFDSCEPTRGRYGYDDSSPIVLMKPVGLPPPVGRFRSRTAASSVGETPRKSSPRSPVSPSFLLSGENEKGSSGLSLATKKRMNRMAAMDQRQHELRNGGSSTIPSPRLVRGAGRMEILGSNGSRRKRQGGENVRSEETVRRGGGGEEDESSTTTTTTTISEYSTSTETERSRVVEDYRDGKSLLERCDKLLHSIAEMNTNNNNGNVTTITELQPSPVSVLDSTFYKEDEEDSPSPVMKRTILHFKDQLQSSDLDEESWSPSSIPVPQLFDLDGSVSSKINIDPPELNYISEIHRALAYLPNDPYPDLFRMLEKNQSLKGRDTSKSSRLHRRLLFDATTEILDRNQQLPPWRSTAQIQPEGIWSEIQRNESKDGWSLDENLFEVVCRVMKRDLAAEGDLIQGWDGCHVEVSEAVLGIERLVFKDLIGEAIRDLDVLAAGRSVGLVVGSAPRRRLVF